jgi:hypothetical protein
MRNLHHPPARGNRADTPTTAAADAAVDRALAAVAPLLRAALAEQLHHLRPPASPRLARARARRLLARHGGRP